MAERLRLTVVGLGERQALLRVDDPPRVQDDLCVSSAGCSEFLVLREEDQDPFHAHCASCAARGVTTLRFTRRAKSSTEQCSVFRLCATQTTLAVASRIRARPSAISGLISAIHSESPMTATGQSPPETCWPSGP